MVHPDGSGLRQVTDVAASGGTAVQPTFTPDARVSAKRAGVNDTNEGPTPGGAGAGVMGAGFTGGAAGTTCGDTGDGSDVPIAFVAVTLNV